MSITVRPIWVDLAPAIFSVQVIIYAIFLIRSEVGKGNPVMETLQVLMMQLAAAMAVATGTTLIILQGVDFVMFLTQRYLKRIDREREAAKAEGIAEGEAKGIAKGKAEGEAKGEAKGIAKGKAEGEAKERELWIAWNNRRLEAEAKGEEFNEPPPTEIQHLTE